MRGRPITWNATRQRLAADRARIQRVLCGQGSSSRPPCLSAPRLCAVLHRLSHHLWSRGHGKLSRLLAQLNLLVTGADIHPHCDLGGGLLIPHPVGVSLSGHAGEDLTVMPLAGIGILYGRGLDVGAGSGLPVLGSRVTLGAAAGVLGPVRIGDDVRVEPGCIITRDVASHTLVSPHEEVGSAGGPR